MRCCATRARSAGRCSTASTSRSKCRRSLPAQLAAAADGEASAVVAGRVRRARERALDRQGTANGELAGEALDRHCRLDDAASHFLQAVTTRLGWSARSFHRVLRVARTVADLEGHAAITSSHLGEAIQYRRALGAA